MALVRYAQRVPSLYNKSALILNVHAVPPLLLQEPLIRLADFSCATRVKQTQLPLIKRQKSTADLAQA
jgi:hypothetical protein